MRGEPGIGKSRLAAEFAQIAASNDFQCYLTSIQDFGTNTGRDALTSLVYSVSGMPVVADTTTKCALLARIAAEPPFADLQTVFLFELFALPVPIELHNVASAMAPAIRDRGTGEAFRALRTQAAGTAPQIVLVEDIHWADTWILERRAILASLTALHPILLVLSTRFDGDPTTGPWRSTLHRSCVVSIDLGPLANDDALQFAQASRVPPELLASCIARAEGNLLFLEHLLLNAELTARTELPGSIQALVLARLD